MSKAFYLAGKMSGVQNFNYEQFAEASDNLRGFGLTVHSPHELFPNQTSWERAQRPYEEYIKAGLSLLINNCNSIILLPGWTDSNGARRELDVALTMRMSTYYYIAAPPFILEIR